MTRTASTSKVLLALIGFAIVVACVTVVAVANPTSAQTGRSVEDLKVTKPGGGEPGPLSAVQKRAMNQGYLVPDQAAFQRAKAEADARSARLSGEPTSGPAAKAPTFFKADFEGIRDTSSGPSDSTSAIGTTRFIELVNTRYAIYNRTSNTPINQGTLNTLVGEPATNSVFDPQVIWDPTTNRFYYLMDDVVSSTDNRIAFGFSKTASPNSAADFCKYVIGHGSEFPDYPKLGDTSNLLLYGTNTFSGPTGSFLGSDLYSITKPPAGTTCPAVSTFTVDAEFNLTGADNQAVFTPVPAQQTDTSSVGYVVAEDDAIYSTGTGVDLALYNVSRNSTGGVTINSTKSVNVPDYKMPATAPQKGTTRKLDTLDGRNTQAVSAIDPRLGKLALWTQHTVFGGSGALVRWFEINPATAGIFQQGSVSGGSGLHVFNAAISPDRKVLGTTKAFGDSMVLNYNTSSSTTFANILMRSKIGAGAISAPVSVHASPTFLNDFTCSSGTCRWGDYSAATPDPASSATGAHGVVWHTNMYVKETGTSGSGWGTRNWAGRP
jgi:hypothetical protein